jgi:hypothetical protein
MWGSLLALKWNLATEWVIYFWRCTPRRGHSFEEEGYKKIHNAHSACCRDVCCVCLWFWTAKC